MKKLSILLSLILISLSICALAAMPAKAGPATITLSTDFGYVGDTVTVSAAAGSGFASGSDLTIKIDSTILTTTPSQVTTNTLGGFAANFTVPNTSVGSHTVTVTDASNNKGSAPFTVNAFPAVVLSPGSWVMDVGQSPKSFLASASGGSGSYVSYRWYVNGSVQSGQTSTFSFSAGSVGTYLITATVTDSLGTTSNQSIPTSVIVSSSPTVTISPAGTLQKNVGQTQILTATPSGGSGTIHYQWYVDSSTVGNDSSIYSYIVPGAPHSVSCRVTDSASVPVTSPPSNAIVIMSNPKLEAPTVSPSPSTINQGQNSLLTSTIVSTGTPPYSYQWFQRVPGGNYAMVGLNSASFNFTTSGTTAL